MLLHSSCCRSFAADVWLSFFGAIDDVSVNAGLDRELSPEAIRSQGEAHGGC